MQLEDSTFPWAMGHLVGYTDLCLHQKKACPVHKWLEFDSTRRADEITSPGLAWPARQTQLSWCSFALWRLAQYQLCNSLSAWAASVDTVMTPNSGKTCFVVVEGFSWSRLNNIYWTKVSSCWSCSGLTWAWLRSFIFSFICYNAENHCLFIFFYSFNLQTRNSELAFWIPWSFRQKNLTIPQTTGNLKIALVPAQLHIVVLEIWVRKYLQGLWKREAWSRMSLLLHSFI